MRRHLRRLLLALALVPVPGRGQVIPAFDLGQNPLTLRGDARPGVYVASAGRRAMAMGTEDGRFELWSWPYKWLHDFQLEFRVPKYTQPIPAPEVARYVTVRPEGVTIEYAYETFTVRQTVFSALEAPAVFMLLEVDAVRPLEIIATFRPDIHLAWPASLGGQYIAWNAAAKAFLFSESRRQVNTFLGSPAVTKASDVPAHMLTASPPQFTIAVGDRSQQYTEPRLGEPPGGNINLHQAFIPIVLAGGEMPRDSARALYDRMLAPGAARSEWEKRVAHYARLRDSTLRVTTPDPLLNAAAEWAKVNLDESMVCNPELGCGLVAGYGLSGSASDRPGFGWFFGGDAAINSFAMSAVGMRDLVRDGVFRFFARYQRADGKITHEISQGAKKVDWFGAYPYAFYHGDTTPFWVLAFGEYFAQSADTALVRELWPNVRKAYDWSRKADSDGDGLMENPIAGAGALEVGDLQVGIVSDVYLSGVWVAALERFARLADVMKEPAVATEARTLRARALRTMEERLWMPGPQQYAFALLEGGKVNENLTAWPATAMAFDTFDPVKGAQMAARLAGSEIMTDWGARPLAAGSTLFDPLHYNNGAVWPFVTGWVALAQFRYFNTHAGLFALQAIARTGFDEAMGRNPEVISGRVYKPLDTAVPHQFFATSMVLTPLVRGMLGLEVDAPAGRVTLAPRLPVSWDSVRVDQVAVGPDRLSVILRRRRGAITAEVWRTAGDANRAIEVTFAPALPPGATNVQSMVPGAAPARAYPGAVVHTSTARLRERLRLGTSWEGGIEVDLATERPRIGDRSRAPRIVSERHVNGRHVVTLQGRARATAQLRVRGAAPVTAITVEPATTVMPPLELATADPSGWQRLTVTMPATGADADGYVTVTLIIG